MKILITIIAISCVIIMGFVIYDSSPVIEWRLKNSLTTNNSNSNLVYSETDYSENYDYLINRKFEIRCNFADSLHKIYTQFIKLIKNNKFNDALKLTSKESIDKHGIDMILNRYKSLKINNKIKTEDFSYSVFEKNEYSLDTLFKEAYFVKSPDHVGYIKNNGRLDRTQTYFVTKLEDGCLRVILPDNLEDFLETTTTESRDGGGWDLPNVQETYSLIPL